ncbi:MAG: MetQ/NlpA family ABC transporter substrate-binding protein [Aristaeellaceae bacterium]
MKKLFALLLTLSLLFSAAALAEGDVIATGKTEILYSKSQGPYTELFEAAIVPLLEEQGYTLTAVETSELLIADQLLQSGEVDVNVEQHSAYAASFNANNDGDLVGISPIPTVPAGVYSVRHASLEEVGKGMTVAIPNDASNTARCLMMLQKIGWITLDPDVPVSAVSVDDVLENPYKLNLIEQKSLTIPAAIQDYDYVAITGSVVYNAGIDASTALANEDIQEHLVLQVTVKAANANTDWAQAIVAAYHSDAFKAYLAEHNDGLWWVPEELR